MRKILETMFICLGIFLFFQFPTIVKASGNYQIEKYNIKADIQKNGDIELTQKIDYQFNGDFHGVYYNQSIKGSKGATDPEVYIKKGKQTTKLMPNDSGQNNTFKVNRTNNLMKLKVYHTTSNDNLTFVYKYRLLGMVTNYRDTAELNWLVINQGWDKNLHNVKIAINLPQRNIPELKAWSHGPLSGYTKVDQKKARVVMTLGIIPAHDHVETHMIFPTDVTSDNPNVINKDKKSKILNQEKQLVLNANASRKRRIWIYRSLMIFGALVLMIIYLVRLVGFLKNRGNKHIIPTPLYHSFNEPRFLPSFTKILLDRSDKADSLGLTADLLVEVGKRRMKIEKFGSTYEIIALKEPSNSFFKYLIEEIGDGKKVNLRQIKSAGQSFKRKKLNQEFDKWSKNAAKGRKKYFDQENIDIVDDFRFMAIAISIISAVIFVISLIFNRNVLLTAVVLAVLISISWLIWIGAKKKITPYSDLGEEEVNQILAFKRMLKDIDDIKMAEVGDLILWEQFLPYAVVFGVSDKVIKALKINFSTEEINQSLIVPFYFGANSFISSGASSFQSSFTSALTSGAGSSSSISGGSGGFTGGSSGGFGGGSGGAF
ncbi:DUF2207 domain-containing protein [Companilactobacillus nuruki]|nr:DUF2207 domain-containing protein [Companilactobacillus nuruki]